MRYLVTGAAGFIGARLVEALLRSGHSTVGVDNVDNAYDTRLKRWRLSRLGDLGGDFEFHEIDIRDVGAVAQSLSGRFDAVFHLAARAGVRPSVEDPVSYVDTNIRGTLNLLEWARKAEVPKFVFASTSSVYGSNGSKPAGEDAPTDRPLSPYAATKKSAEAMLHAYHHLHGMDVSILRYFTVYGPAGRPDMSIFRFVRWIIEGEPVTVFGDGSQRRDFTYVDDIVDGTILALKPVGCEPFNLGSDSPVRLMEVIHQIEARSGKQARLEFRPQHKADVPATHASIVKAKTSLLWRPRVQLPEGIQHVIDWYGANRAWAREVA